jgi:CHAD domain-containing protein
MSSSRIARAFNKSLAAVDKELKSFLEKGDAATVHDLRAAIRKLESSYSLVPKAYRPRPVKKYVRSARELRKATNALRDCDVILAALSSLPVTREYEALIGALRNSRARDVRVVLRDAKDLAGKERPELSEDDLRGARVQRRMEDMTDRLQGRVNKELSKFLKTHDVETMHELRKDSRRLRYALELYDGEASGDVLNRLREIQNSLGAVRDDDLVIAYVRRARPPVKSRQFFREKTAERHAKIEEFVAKHRAEGPFATS